MRPQNPYQVRDREALQECMREARQVVPHTTRSMGRLIGVSHATISDLLTGKKARLSLSLAQRFSAALGRPMADLFVPTASVSADKDSAVEVES